MRKMLLTLSAATIALAAAPLDAQGRGGGGGGGGRGGGGGQTAQRGGGGGGGQAAQRGGGRNQGAQQRGGGGQNQARGGGGRQQQTRQADRGRDQGGRGQGQRVADNDRGRGQDRLDRGHGRDQFGDRGRGPGQGRNDDLRRNGRQGEFARGRGPVERRASLVTNPRNIAHVNRWDTNRGLVNGCPPGLARRNNGCLPPGQARHLAQGSMYGGLWPRYRGGNYTYANGYLLRLGAGGIASGFIPLAGGALWRGNAWPTGYAYDPVPEYFTSYYGMNQPYDYRYADGIVYGLDPETQMIQQVAGLMTGDSWGIGQAMPVGYDIYNVPSAYRAQYYDTPESLYRYSDGYIYQVDPTTQLVQAAISLIA